MARPCDQAGKVRDPEIEEMLITSQNRIRAMSLIHEKLYHSDEVALVNLLDYTQSLCREVIHFTTIEEENRPDLRFHLEPIYTGIDFAIPYGLVLNELILNSHKHAFSGIENPEIVIRLQREEDCITLELEDNGVGMPADMDFSDPQTLGMQLIRSLVDQLNGELEVSSRNGTLYRMRFPVDKDSSLT